MGMLMSLWDRFRGAGEAALSVPTFDGAFKPNQAIEEAALVASHPTPDNLASAGGRLFFSSGAKLLALKGSGEVEMVEDGADHITAMAGAPDGTLAVARSGKGLSFPINPGGLAARAAIGGSAGDITAIAFADAGLAVTVGSERFRATEWRHDMMSKGRSGSVWLLPRNGEPARLAAGLAFPYGVAAVGDGGFLVSECWRSALLRVGARAKPEEVVSNLPAYPARLAAAAGGGYWLALFAPRNQILEFVLREPGYRARMMREIEPIYWVVPMLVPSDYPLDPMLRGVQKVSGGDVNPWGSSLSYGLVARLGADFMPEYSYHSRANGRRHGITSVVEHDGRLIAASYGGSIVDLPTDRR